jgi:hypothetical protein
LTITASTLSSPSGMSGPECKTRVWLVRSLLLASLVVGAGPARAMSCAAPGAELILLLAVGPRPQDGVAHPSGGATAVALRPGPSRELRPDPRIETARQAPRRRLFLAHHALLR